MYAVSKYYQKSFLRVLNVFIVSNLQNDVQEIADNITTMLEIRST